MTRVVNISWIDKRHITLRSTIFKDGAQCEHYKDEAQAEKSVNSIIDGFAKEGYIIKQLAPREWVATKQGE